MFETLSSAVEDNMDTDLSSETFQHLVNFYKKTFDIAYFLEISVIDLKMVRKPFATSKAKIRKLLVLLGKGRPFL